MKDIVKEFFLRGLVVSGFGPLVYACVMFVLYLCGVDTLINGLVLFKGVISTYMMAFLIAGVSVIWKIEKLGLSFSILIHGTILYLCYLVTYLVNGWVASNPISLVVFTGIFIGGYLLIWLFIYLVEKNRAKRLNIQLNK